MPGSIKKEFEWTIIEFWLDVFIKDLLIVLHLVRMALSIFGLSFLGSITSVLMILKITIEVLSASIYNVLHGII